MKKDDTTEVISLNLKEILLFSVLLSIQDVGIGSAPISFDKQPNLFSLVRGESFLNGILAV
jgi:hypothetical protein